MNARASTDPHTGGRRPCGAARPPPSPPRQPVALSSSSFCSASLRPPSLISRAAATHGANACAPFRSPSLSRRRRSSGGSLARALLEDNKAAATPATTPATTPAATRTQPSPSPDRSVLALVGVSLLWGTYAPSLRYLFLFDEGLTPATLTAWRTALSAAAMLAAAVASGAFSAEADADAASSADDASSSSSSSFSSSWLRAGAEIGLYNFLGTACQVTGVHATTATKAAFLGQATTALTPALAALSGLLVSPLQWGACAAAVAGSALIAADDLAEPTAAAIATAASAVTSSLSSPSSPTAPPLSGGEPLVLLACVFYAMSTVRMAVHAPRHPAARLATAKTGALAALSLVWALVAAAAGVSASGNAIGDGADGLLAGPAAASAAAASSFSLALPPALAGSSVALAALAYSALGPGALATWLQASGQSSVPAAEAQVIFSLTPVWTAGLSAAAAWVGVAGATAAESAMGGGAWAGSLLVLAASLAVALEGRPAVVGAAAAESGDDDKEGG